tara:strand:- start:111 stop:1028 length:918 start_codon:yes stop_codon:yes gene_type:complete
MNILVTGGAGFVGANLCVKLIDKGYKVFIIDDLSTGSEKNIPPNTDFFRLNLSFQETYNKLPKNIDIVFHLSSQVSSEKSFLDPINDMKRNSFATLLLLEWSLNNSIKKFIYTSTMGVYSDGLKEAANECSKINPKSFYGFNKRSSENFIELYSQKGLKSTIFRLFNCYGPGQNMADFDQGMLSIYLAYLLLDKPVLVKGSLDRTRDFVYIDDVTDAVLLGLKSKSTNNIYNVCSGKETSVKQLIKELLVATNKSSNYPINILPRTPNDIDQIWGDCNKLKDDFDWLPKYSLKDGIKKYISLLNI